jgi:hypothetical protein
MTGTCQEVPLTHHTHGDLAGLEAVRAVKRLQHAWGHYAEAGDYTAMADLFSSNGRAVIGSRTAEGRAQIIEFIVDEFGAGHAQPGPELLYALLLMSPVVTVSADRLTARARWHEVALTGWFGVHAGWSGGIQENEYVLEDGVWRIAVLHHHPQYAGPHSSGWRNLSADVPLVPFHFTPDEAGAPLAPLQGFAADTPLDAAEAAARAQRLRDERLVQNLLAAYGHYVDRKLWDDVADLFGHTGRLAWDDEEWRGQDTIRRGLEERSPAGLRHGEFHDHLQLMPVVTVAADGSEARARVVELQTLAEHGLHARWGVRVGEARFIADGATWRIADLAYTTRLLADHDAGWAAQVAGDSLSSYPRHRGPAVSFAHPVRDPQPPVTSRARTSAVDLSRLLGDALTFDAAENVACAYGYFLDEAHWDETADLFARDGWKELSFVGTYIGRDRIRASLIARYGRRPRRPTFLPIHQKTQPYVTLLEDGRALIRLKMLQINSGWDVDASTVAGVYEEQIVREDGVWRIHGMDLEYIVVADWDGGPAAVAPGAGRRFAPTDEAIAAFDPAPDAPLRGLAFAPYPEIGPLGFHFPNPVSGREPALRFTWTDGRFDAADPTPRDTARDLEDVR